MKRKAAVTERKKSKSIDVNNWSYIDVYHVDITFPVTSDILLFKLVNFALHT